MLPVLLLVFAASFAAAFASAKFIIRKLSDKKFVNWDVGFLVPDLARRGKPLVPRLGGLALVAGITFGVLLSVKLIPAADHVLLFAALTTTLLVGIMALFSDMVKLSDRLRTIIPLVAALPLVAVSAGVTSMAVPFIGSVDFGVFYSLILVPLGVAACSNLFNLLAGHNGLEAGTAGVAAAAVLAALFLRQQALPTMPFAVPAILLTAIVGACLAFLYFNWYPARIFPGDVGTYSLGAVLAAAIIVGNIETVGVIALAPQIAEFFLKARFWFKAENFGKLRGDHLYYEGKTSSLTHLVMKRFNPTEKQLTLILLSIQALCGILAVAVGASYWSR